MVDFSLYALLPGKKQKPREVDDLRKAKAENKKASDDLGALLTEMLEDLRNG